MPVIDRPDSPWWTMQRGDDVVVATAIHDGAGLRADVEGLIALPAAQRLREEDPHTGQAIVDVPTHVIARRSRFEVDLNRAEADAVYLEPAQCWGLQPWLRAPDERMVETSRRLHRSFYSMLGQLLDEISAAHGRFLVLDVHSYNHRRDGPDAAPMPQAAAPDINIGTHSMPRAGWAFLLEPLIEAMRSFDFRGRRLDVRENVAFEGRGELARYVHERYPNRGCAVALEFKKFYMDEWTGEPDPAELAAMRDFITHVANVGRDVLRHRR